MLDIDNYMDAAKAAAGLASDRQLGRALGIGPTAPTNWRTRKAWPADDTTIRLAELAGLDAGQALLDLNRWRATTPAVESAYERIAAKIASTAAAIAIFVGAGSGTAEAAQVLSQLPQASVSSVASAFSIIYIMRFLCVGFGTVC